MITAIGVMDMFVANKKTTNDKAIFNTNFCILDY